MENKILAATNFPALFASLAYAMQGRFLCAFVVAAAGIASVVYHLIECHKHSMPGIGIYKTRKDHLWFINIDRFFAVLAMLVCGWDMVERGYWIVLVEMVTRHGWVGLHFVPGIFTLLYLLVFGLLGLTVSEQVSDCYPPNQQRLIHVISHGLWHICIFSIPLVFAII